MLQRAVAQITFLDFCLMKAGKVALRCSEISGEVEDNRLQLSEPEGRALVCYTLTDKRSSSYI